MVCYKLPFREPSEKKRIVKTIQENKPIILPTDTLYALSASAISENAVAEVFNIKKRSEGKALPVLVSSTLEAAKYFCFNELAINLAKLFWPGPMTLILESKGFLAKNISGTNKIAVRMPNHKILLDIIEEVGHPITGTSANISGEQYVHNIEIIREKFGDSIDILQDNEIADSEPSTIVDCTSKEIQLIREGVIKSQDIMLQAR